jgi:hypothetical protein
MKKFQFSHYEKEGYVFNYKNYQAVCYGLLENWFDKEMDYRDLLFNFEFVRVYKNGEIKKEIYNESNCSNILFGGV